MGDTKFVDIPEVGGAGRGKTAVFFPSAVTRKQPYNLLIYLHGDRMPAVENWISSDPRFPLREKVEASGKSLVLVAPSLTWSSRAGKLETDPDWYIDRVLEEIGKLDGGDPAKLVKLVIAAHSGGGYRMFQMMSGMSKYKPNLTECWGFDCLYQPVGDPIPYKIPKGRVWAPKPHPLMGEIEYLWATSMVPLRVHYLIDGSTSIRSQNLDNLNYDVPYCRALVFPTRHAHDVIPGAHIGERLTSVSV